MSFDRYKKFRTDGGIETVPFINIPKRDTDYYKIYNKRKDRLDIISYDYYGDADFVWLILQANAQYGSIEYELPDQVELRIPYPLNEVLENYMNEASNLKLRNGTK